MVRNALKSIFVIKKSKGNWVFEKLANRVGATASFLLRTVLVSILVPIYISLCFSPLFHCSFSPSSCSSSSLPFPSYSLTSVRCYYLLPVRGWNFSLIFAFSTGKFFLHSHFIFQCELPCLFIVSCKFPC